MILVLIPNAIWSYDANRYMARLMRNMQKKSDILTEKRESGMVFEKRDFCPDTVMLTLVVLDADQNTYLCRKTGQR